MYAVVTSTLKSKWCYSVQYHQQRSVYTTNSVQGFAVMHYIHRKENLGKRLEHSYLMLAPHCRTEDVVIGTVDRENSVVKNFSSTTLTDKN